MEIGILKRRFYYPYKLLIVSEDQCQRLDDQLAQKLAAKMLFRQTPLQLYLN